MFSGGLISGPLMDRYGPKVCEAVSHMLIYYPSRVLMDGKLTDF